MTARCALVSSLLFITPALAWANPVNTERLGATNDRKGWNASLDGSAAVRAGNVDRIDLGFGGGVQYRTFFAQPSKREDTPRYLHDRWLLSSNLALARVNGEDVVDSGFMHSRYTRMLIPRVGVEVYLQSQYNAFTRLRARMLSGTGARFEITHRRWLSMWGGTGYMAEYEVNETVDNDPHPAETFNHRWANYFAMQSQLIEGQLLLRNTTYVQPRFDDFADVRVLNGSQIEAAVGKVFALGIDVELQYDSRPPREIEPLDLRLSSYIRFRFG